MSILIKRLLNEGLFIEAPLNEIEKELDFSSFKIKNTLNPEVWVSGDKLKPEIKDTLIKIAKTYYDSLKLNLPIKDIILTGSLSNYNWSKYSDFDVHILIDTKKFGEKEELIKDLIDAKTRSWNDSHDIKIKNYDVELYIQGIDQENHSTGVYSLMNEKWVLKPEMVKPEIDKALVTKKYNLIIDKLSDIKKEFEAGKYETVVNRIEKLKDKVKKMRQAGLEGGGEFSPENIAFKLLRRNNVMEELYDILVKAYDKSVSIDEMKLNEDNNSIQYSIKTNDKIVTISAKDGDSLVGVIILKEISEGYDSFDGLISQEQYDSIFSDSKLMEIEQIKVNSDYRKRGIAKELMKKTIDYANGLGYDNFYLNASPMGYDGLDLNGLVKFYSSFGFNQIPFDLKTSGQNVEMYLNQSNGGLNEAKDKKITCKNCGWLWKESESKKEDLYLCHKCGYDNTPRK